MIVSLKIYKDICNFSSPLPLASAICGKYVYQFNSVSLVSKCVNPKYFVLWNKPVICVMLLCVVYNKEQYLLRYTMWAYWRQSSFPLGQDRNMSYKTLSRTVDANQRED